MEPERRCAVRVHCLVPVRVYPAGAHQAIETLTRDLSPGGVCVFSPVALPADSHVTAEAVLGSGQAPIVFRARTAWSRPMLSGSQFFVGLQFDRDQQQIHRLLSAYIDKLSLQPSS